MRSATAAIVSILVLALVTPVPGFAGNCTTWSASVEQLEEGRALVASVCSKQDERTFLLVRCFPPGLNIRYSPAIDGDFNNFQRDLIFETDQGKRPVFVTYEGLDGAFSAYLPLGHTAAEMLKSGKTITIRDPRRQAPSHTFPLSGSRKALEKLEKSCNR